METGNGNKQFWSRWSGRYDWFMRGNEPLYEEMAARIKTRLDRRMNVLELACGTGATAAFCAGLQRGLIASPAEMQLPGGTLRFERTENGHVIMTGPAEEAFRGKINLASRESV